MTIKNKRKKMYKYKLVYTEGIFSQIQSTNMHTYKSNITTEELTHFISDLADNLK